MSHLARRYGLGFILIVIAGAVYIILRPDDIFGGLPVLFPTMSSLKVLIPKWLLYTLPDALWYASLLCFQRPFHYVNGRLTPVLTLLACLTGPLHEALQYLELVPGTFCPVDLLSYCTILLIYIILCLRNSERTAVTM